jgi:hypothetical protein
MVALKFKGPILRMATLAASSAENRPAVKLEMKI